MTEKEKDAILGCLVRQQKKAKEDFAFYRGKAEQVRQMLAVVTGMLREKVKDPDSEYRKDFSLEDQNWPDKEEMLDLLRGLQESNETVKDISSRIDEILS